MGSFLFFFQDRYPNGQRLSFKVPESFYRGYTLCLALLQLNVDNNPHQPVWIVEWEGGRALESMMVSQVGSSQLCCASYSAALLLLLPKSPCSHHTTI